jgi:hypothetical protein
LPHLDPDRLRRRDQLRGIVDTDDLRAALDDLVRQSAVAAADVEDPLAKLRVEQIERGLAEVGDEATDPGIVRGIPAAGRGDRDRQSVFTQSR